MHFPSITLILSCIFFVYIAHSMYVLSTLFLTLKCSQQPCFTSYLSTKPQLQLILFTSTQSSPTSIEVTNIATINNFTYTEELQRYVIIIVATSDQAHNKRKHPHCFFVINFLKLFCFQRHRNYYTYQNETKWYIIPSCHFS